LLQKISPAYRGNFLHRNYEKTGAETMAREVDLHPVHEADPGKLACQAHFPPPRDNGLVPDKEECSDKSCVS
jgi:hypothetical protein